MNEPINIWADNYPTDKKLPEFENFPFELDHFQKWAIESMIKGENVLVTAGTGSGKTVVAEFAIQQGVKAGKKVIYTSPIKSLSNQKFHEFNKKFGPLANHLDEEDRMSIGILTGDIKFNPEAQVLIMTTEILRNLLYHKEVPIDPVTGQVLSLDVNTEVSSVVFDEVHYINDKDRGKVWEECLILLPNHINLVLLSATIDQPEIFGSWLQQIKGKKLNLIPTHKRVIPLKHYLFMTVKGLGQDGTGKGNNRLLPDEVDFIQEWTGKLVPLLETVDDGSKTGQAKFYEDNYHAVLRVKKKHRHNVNHGEIFSDMAEFLHHRKMTPALFFTLSRKKCQEYAGRIHTNLNSAQEQAEVDRLINFHLHQLDQPEIYKKLGQFLDLKDLLIRGIAYHHSGLIPVLKEIIEILFAKNLIKILFATETFAVGVNMPTKTVVFTGLTKFDGVSDFRYLETHEYQQMAGRAGRRGLDPIGHVVLLPNLEKDMPTAQQMRNIMTGRAQIIRSQFTLNYAFLMKAILTEGISLQAVLETSFMNQELKDQLTGLETMKAKMEPDLPTEDFKDCERYEQLMSNAVPGLDGLGGLIKLSQKQVKKNRKEAKQMESRSGFRDKLARYHACQEMIYEYEKIMSEIHNCRTTVHAELFKVLRFMQELGYLVSDLDLSNPEFKISNLTPSHVTIKGVLASHINQCQELILTEMIVQGYLDDLEPAGIAAILAIFLDTKVEEEIYSTATINIPFDLKGRIDDIIKLAEDLNLREERKYIYVGSNWNLNLGMIGPCYHWAKGADLQKILTMTGSFEGNLVKDMLKVSHLAEEVKTLAELVDKQELVTCVNQVPALLIREVVTVDSLYLKVQEK